MQDLSVYQERLEKELSVIHQMGFDDYFLIVADLLRYAREQDIYCGMGRGSAAGSLVAYVLGITMLTLFNIIFSSNVFESRTCGHARY